MTPGEPAPVELPEDLQSELDALAAGETTLSHYALLGVAADADVRTIRRAYLERSRRYHPDSWYGKQLGRFAPLLTRAFQRLNRAFQTLCEDGLRAEYDRDHLEKFSPNERTQILARQAAEADESRRVQERRSRLLRTKGFARLGAARQLYEQALQHANEGQRGLAISALTCARELDPERKEIVQRLHDLEKEQVQLRAASALAVARDQEDARAWSKALSLYATALQLNPRVADAALGATRCAAALGDFAQQLTFALRACELAPMNLDGHLSAARAFAALKQKPRAKAQLQLILAREPHHSEALALMKSL